MTKNSIIQLGLFLFSTIIYAQNEFEKGYFHSNQGERIECLIKNMNWLDSPKQVFYKFTDHGEVKSFDVRTVSKFQVGDGALFVRVSDDFPVTKKFESEKEIDPKPKMVSRSVFVKKLLDGEASLYEYRGENDRIFLLQVGENNPFPLLYKQYVKESTNDIHDNNAFRRQLLQNLNCDVVANIQTVEYVRKSLISYLMSYNKCMNPESKSEILDSSTKRAGGETRFLIFGGIASYQVETDIAGRSVDFENKIVPIIGFELESILPFNNRKWSAFLSAQYASYKATGNAEINSVQINVANLELNQITTHVGGRHYLFLNDKTSVFFQLGATIDFNTNSTLNEEPGFQTALDEISSMAFGGFGGLGLAIDQKYYLTTRYLIGTSIFRNDLDNPNNLKRIAVSIEVKL